MTAKHNARPELTSFSVKKLFGQHDHSISLNPDGLTLIHGPNGVGKTSVLRLIHHALELSVSDLASFVFDELSLTFDDSSQLTVTRVAEEGMIEPPDSDHVDDVGTETTQVLLLRPVIADCDEVGKNEPATKTPKHPSRRRRVQTSEYPRLGQKFHSFGERAVNQIATASAVIVIVLGIPAISSEVAVGAAPAAETIDHNPQFFIDDYLVDNRWGVQFLTETVTRVSHQPGKHTHNPVIAGNGGYLNVVRDERTGLFRMWYQDYWDQSINPRKYTYGVAYAESKDGIHWKLPRIGKYDFKGTRDNNIVLLGPENGRAETPFLLDVPREHRRGYEYLMLYTTNVRDKSGMHVIGSKDGITWDSASDVRIAADFTPDTQAGIVWDPKRAKFVCFTRATNIYRAKGERRKIARLENNSLWGPWPVTPENILLPDSLDARTGHNYFYGMPTRYYAGIYWGFLWPYRHQEDIYTELAFSRDGRNFQRFPDRPRLIDLGPDKSWDGGMVLGSPAWIEVGDEWWIYYTATNEAHNSQTSTPGIGLARIRKEGFASLRSPPGGGFVVTRLLRWPGGRLFVNADVSRSEMTVRITDYNRQPLTNFDSGPSLPIVGNSVRHEVRWKTGDIRDLNGLAIRIEFFMESRADLYSFRAGPPEDNP